MGAFAIRSSKLAVWLAVLCMLASGCRTRAPARRGEAAEPAEKRFAHARHDTLACTECHALDSVLAGTPAMPGAADHAPCDRGQCHEEEFLGAPGELCQVCHESVDASRPGRSPLLPYPPTRGRRALASRFAHDRHLDFASLERQVGFHVVCTDCHMLDRDGAPGRPGHDVCGRCHAPESAGRSMPAVSECASCHEERPKQPSRARRFIVDDLRFRHGNHQRDRRGKDIRCVECHADTPGVRSVLGHQGPDTSACVDCHDDFERTPSSKRMRVCETCHGGRTRTIGVLAPRSHLPKLELPEDHTLAFRQDHADAARAASERCARCHTFMSGAPRDVCDECHQVMRPRDHTVTWREFDHGPEASARADTCATCHTGTFCATCHAQVPRSHRPLSMFRDSGHSLPAKLDMRSCLTCHDPATSCTGAGCHTLGGP